MFLVIHFEVSGYLLGVVLRLGYVQCFIFDIAVLARTTGQLPFLISLSS